MFAEVGVFVFLDKAHHQSAVLDGRSFALRVARVLLLRGLRVAGSRGTPSSEAVAQGSHFYFKIITI